MENCAAPEGETHAGRANRRRTRPQTAKRHPRPRKRRTRGSEIRGPEEFEPEARASGMEAGDIAPEARGAGRARCEERRENKKEGEPRKDVTLKRSFAARQTPPISASGAFATAKTACFRPACSREDPHPMHARGERFGPSAQCSAQARLHAELSFSWPAAHAATFKSFRTQRSAHTLAPHHADVVRKTVAPPGMTLEKLLQPAIDNAPAFPCDARTDEKAGSNHRRFRPFIVFGTTSET